MTARGSAARLQARTLAGDCYYEHTVHRVSPRAALASSQEADVVVVGAGFAGLHCALELAQRGNTVLVLEAELVGSGASGRNGGQLLPGYSCDFATLTAALGNNAAQELWAWSVEGMDAVRERAQATDAEYRPGSLLFATRQRHVGPLRAWYEHLKGSLRYGSDLEFAEQADLPYWTSARNYYAALVDARAGHLNPLKLLLSLARQCEEAGVTIHEHSPVSKVLPGAPAQVHTAAGIVACRHVVVAANVFVDGLVLPQSRRIMSVGNCMIATEPLGSDLANGLLRNRFSAYDTNFMLDYYRVTADHRMLWGGASSYLRPTPKNSQRVVRQKMIERFPQLSSARIEYTWGGLIDVTASRAPDFGRLGDSIYYLQGFSGHGLNVSAIGARVVAEALHGDARRFEVFERLKHANFPNSPVIRRLVLSAGTWYYRMVDHWG